MVNKESKGKENICQLIKDANGLGLGNEVEVRNRLKEYFEGVLNVIDDKEREVNGLGLGNFTNERSECEMVCKEEVRNALRKVESSRMTGLDGIVKGGKAFMGWLRRIFNLCANVLKVPED